MLLLFNFNKVADNGPRFVKTGNLENFSFTFALWLYVDSMLFRRLRNNSVY
jgi:hypothetical protein